MPQRGHGGQARGLIARDIQRRKAVDQVRGGANAPLVRDRDRDGK